MGYLLALFLVMTAIGVAKFLLKKHFGEDSK